MLEWALDIFSELSQQKRFWLEAWVFSLSCTVWACASSSIIRVVQALGVCSEIRYPLGLSSFGTGISAGIFSARSLDQCVEPAYLLGHGGSHLCNGIHLSAVFKMKAWVWISWQSLLEELEKLQGLCLVWTSWLPLRGHLTTLRGFKCQDVCVFSVLKGSEVGMCLYLRAGSCVCVCVFWERGATAEEV